MNGCRCPEALSYGVLNWTREGLYQGFAQNKGANQTAHLLSLISAFVIHILESIMFRLAASESSIFLLVS